jgi:PKD repeat protein
VSRRRVGSPPRQGFAAIPFAVGLLLTGLVVSPGSTSATSGARVGCAPPYSVSATPQNGSAPLLVSFTLSGPVSGGTALSWAFGDGEFLNGTGPNYAFAAHSYAGPGTFNATVTVDPAAPSARCSSTISVRPGPLVVSFIASAYTGRVPLTVQFNGTARGGTGDYRSELWSFGDGGAGSGFNATYTFGTPGTFRVTLTVADSAGAQGEAERSFTIQSAVAITGPIPRISGGPDLIGWAVLSAGIGVAVAGIGFAYYTRRRVSTARPTEDAGLGRAPQSTTAHPALDVRPSAPPRGPDPPKAGPTASSPKVADPRASPFGPGAPPATVPRNVLQTSQRVLAHLYRQGAPPPTPLGIRSLTQAGMGEALGIEQSNLARVVKRLEVAGALTHELRHVPGTARRVRVYLLTPVGQRIGAGLVRHEAAPTDSPR